MIGRYDRGVTRRVRLLSDLVAERDEVLEEKTYLRGVHPPDKICTRCKSECGPSIAPQHDTLCDACAMLPDIDPEKFWSDLAIRGTGKVQVYGLPDRESGFDLQAKLYVELQAAADKVREAYDLPVPRFVATERTHVIDCDMDEDCRCEPCEICGEPTTSFVTDTRWCGACDARDYP